MEPPSQSQPNPRPRGDDGLPCIAVRGCSELKWRIGLTESEMESLETSAMLQVDPDSELDFESLSALATEREDTFLDNCSSSAEFFKFLLTLRLKNSVH